MLTSQSLVWHASSLRCHASTCPILLCQRSRHCLYRPADHDLLFVKIHSTTDRPTLHGKALHQQIVSRISRQKHKHMEWRQDLNRRLAQ